MREFKTDLTGKVAVVTGARQGLGKIFATALLRGILTAAADGAAAAQQAERYIVEAI